MFLSLWPTAQKFKFINSKYKFLKSKVDYIESFFAKRYKSKYCMITPSARSAIITVLNFKKFTRSKIFKIPKWSSHCLYDSIGSLTNVGISENKHNGSLIVHHLGQSFKTKNKKSLYIDDSADSLPNDKFKACINSNIAEVISLPKIIGSYCGGIILTNNFAFFSYVKKLQTQKIEFASIQSKKKYDCLVMKKMDFDWHYNESFNFSLDFNTCENIYENLKNFEINKNVILKRFNQINKKNLKVDNYRIGPCIILDNKKKYSKILDTLHINISRSYERNYFIKKSILPIHFTISDQELEKKLNDISKY